MARKSGNPAAHRTLRERAEHIDFSQGPQARVGWHARDLARLLHELQVHQVELEMQNEELRTIQTQLSDSRDRYLELYDLAPVAYLTLDRSGRIVEANRSAAQLLGSARVDLLGAAFCKFMSERHADQLYAHLYAVFETGARQGCEVVLEVPAPPGGVACSVPVHVTSIVSSDDDVAGSQCRTALIDLSSLRHAQEVLRSSEERNQTLEGAIRDGEARFRQVADHLQDMLAVVASGPLRLEYVNPAFEATFGRKFEDLAADVAALPSWIHPEDRDRVERAHAEFLRGGAFDVECRLLRPDGAVRWVRGRSFGIDGTGGAPVRYVSLIQDITAQREMELELRQAQKMEAVGALASGVAHDFNNVLQGVLGCISLAQRPGTTPAQLRDFLEQAADAARRGGGLSARLMSFAHKRDLDEASTVIDAMITRSAPLLERLLTEQVVLELQLDAGDATVRADAVQLEQILLNLAANARDAMPGGGRLLIRSGTIGHGELPAGLDVRRAERYVRLQVQDFGLGMDEATKVRIFEPFFTTKQPGMGTGLGLSTVFSVARELGGHVDAQSQVNRGSTFTIHLPCCEPPVAADAVQPAELPRLQGVVLLVEDEPVVLLTVHHHLEDLGLKVLDAADAFEAQRWLRRYGGRIDLLISDVVLPGMRGTVLAESVQRQHPELKVLFMTANPELLAHDPGGNLGAPVLRKPFGREELGRQLVALLPQTECGRGRAAGTRPSEDSAAGAPSTMPRELAGDSAVLLLVDDDDGARAALATLLEDRGYRVLSAAGPGVALAMAQEHRIDLLLTDVAMPEMPGDVLAESVRALHPRAAVVLMSGIPVRPVPGTSFLLKPFDLDALLSLVTLELQRVRPDSKAVAAGRCPASPRTH